MRFIFLEHRIQYTHSSYLFVKKMEKQGPGNNDLILVKKQKSKFRCSFISGTLILFRAGKLGFLVPRKSVLLKTSSGECCVSRNVVLLVTLGGTRVNVVLLVTLEGTRVHLIVYHTMHQMK